jgi:hypothetical protein
MAKSKIEVVKNRREDEWDVPEGFNVNAGRERGEGWILKAEGNEVMGRLVGRQSYKTKRGKTRAFYQIKLAKPCMCEVTNPDFNEEADEDEDNMARIQEKLDAGSVVNVDEFKKLEDLEPYTKDGGVYDVWFVMGGKIDIGDDQTMWTLKAGPRLKVIEEPKRSPF